MAVVVCVIPVDHDIPLFTVNSIPNIQKRTINRKLGSKMEGDRRFKTQRKKN